MSIQEICAAGGITLMVLLTLVQITPIKINPWTAIAKAIGRALNGDVLSKLDKLEAGQEATRRRLDDHVRIDDERNADIHRIRILRFNTELLRDMKHTREDFIEILSEIDFYETYCKEHKEYKNNRAVLAIENIERVYRQRMEKNDFL